MSVVRTPLEAPSAASQPTPPAPPRRIDSSRQPLAWWMPGAAPATRRPSNTGSLGPFALPGRWRGLAQPGGAYHDIVRRSIPRRSRKEELSRELATERTMSDMRDPGSKASRPDSQRSENRSGWPVPHAKGIGARPLRRGRCSCLPSHSPRCGRVGEHLGACLAWLQRPE